MGTVHNGDIILFNCTGGIAWSDFLLAWESNLGIQGVSLQLSLT